MIDIKFIRENQDIVKNACKLKGFIDNTDKILELDKKVRELKTLTESKVAEKNKISKEIPNSSNKEELIKKSKLIDDEISEELKELADKENLLKDLLFTVPQIPNEDSPVGEDDKSNTVIKTVGKIRNFDFTPLAQWDILDRNNWWYPEKISQISGARTYCLIGEAAELNLAVQMYVINKLISKGFKLIECPSITKLETVFNAGHFLGSDLSIMKDDVFILKDTDKCLAGTSEIILNSIHRDEILKETQLPIKYIGLSQCFRKEAGAAGRDTRGLVRFHQFNKVEQFVFCTEEQAEGIYQLLLNNLCETMEDLELPYRIIANSTGDMGFNKVKMNDVEAWIPSENTYREMGSCSFIGDFQSRRTNTRYREDKTGKLKFCYTLNNTGIALPRAIAPFIENHQNADGSVNIPIKLQPYLGGRTKIGNKN